MRKMWHPDAAAADRFEDRLYNRGEVCEVWGVSDGVFARECLSSVLWRIYGKTVKVGERVLYDGRALAAHIRLISTDEKAIEVVADGRRLGDAAFERKYRVKKADAFADGLTIRLGGVVCTIDGWLDYMQKV